MIRGKLCYDSQDGLTLLEVALALALAGILIGFVWAVLSTSLYNSHLSTTEQGITTLAANIREYFRDRQIALVGDISNAIAINANLVPNELLIGGAVKYGLGVGANAAITISYDKANCGTSSFEFTMATMQGQACNDLLTHLVGTVSSTKSQAISQVLVGGTAILNSATGALTSPTAISTSCTNGTKVEICFTQF